MNYGFIFGWRYEAGGPTTRIIGKHRLVDPGIPAGWYCSASVNKCQEMANWMAQNLSGFYECECRFNSGSPLWTIYIKEETDAILFKLNWGDSMAAW